ncbi:MAG: hypothetical protein HYU97_03610 [Deltaproteobacteria bacterium]|nr:hypothetical protein [Deltaproteobacteria bacterium]
MKNILSIFCLLALTISFAGCGCGLDFGTPAPFNIKHYLAVPNQEVVVYSTQRYNAEQDAPALFKTSFTNGKTEKLAEGEIVDFIVTASGEYVYFFTTLSSASATGSELYRKSLVSQDPVETIHILDANGQPILFYTNNFLHINYLLTADAMVIRDGSIVYFTVVDDHVDDFTFYKIGSFIHEEMFVNSQAEELYWLKDSNQLYKTSFQNFVPQLVKQLPESASNYGLNKQSNLLVYENLDRQALFSIHLQTGQIQKIFDVSTLGDDFELIDHWEVNPELDLVAASVVGQKKGIVLINLNNNAKNIFTLNSIDGSNEYLFLEHSSDGEFLFVFEGDLTAKQLSDLQSDPDLVETTHVQLHVFYDLTTPNPKKFSTSDLGEEPSVSSSRLAFDLAQNKAYYAIYQDLFQLDLIGFSQNSIFHRSAGVHSVKLAGDHLLANTSDGAFLSSGEILFAIDIDSQTSFQITAD